MANSKAIAVEKKKITWKILKNQKYLIFMSLPFVVWVVIFAYMPLWGWTMAFQNYKPNKSFFEQVWVGLTHFEVLFSDRVFLPVMRNTLAMSIMGLVFGFFMPVIFALLLNEVRLVKFKKAAQTISYLPHFVSWVVAANIVTTMLSIEGPINELLVNLGIFKEPYMFMTNPKLFWLIVTLSDVWKETGWNAIIYLAAITGIDQELYEAARVDGANRLHQMWYITLPGIKPTIVVILILNLGSLINIGFEKQLLLGNSIIKDYATVLDLYALDYGIGMFRYSFGTAIGIFKSVISIVLLFSVNRISKRLDQGTVI